MNRPDLLDQRPREIVTHGGEAFAAVCRRARAGEFVIESLEVGERVLERVDKLGRERWVRRPGGWTFRVFYRENVGSGAGAIAQSFPSSRPVAASEAQKATDGAETEPEW